ncbi:MAG TPA: hypothetical protein VKB80_30685 [Kofleriaceae bacterium]|nr:hypothetical protein [Kofleriaceae bacterium]
MSSASAASARCPKCDADVAAGAGSCPACGLSADRFDDYQRDPVDASPEVAAAWEACASSWDDDAAHERFRAAAAASGAFAFAAARYRQAARERAGDERAAAGVARIRRMAEAALLARPPAAELARAARAPGEHDATRPFRGAAMLLVALVLLVSLGLVAAFTIRALRGGTHRDAREPAPSSTPRRSW